LTLFRYYQTGGKDMENLFFIIISSFLPLTLLHLFAERDSSMGPPQMGFPQMGQRQRGASLSQGLKAYSLPAGAIAENDMPQIKTIIQQVLGNISESMKTAGQRADNQTIKSGILAFQDWLKAQGCVSQASTTYDIETADRYSENIFITYPGQLPFDIVFKMDGDVQKPYRLLIFVTPADLFNFASLVENKSIGGVPVPESWPKDSWSYWDDRP
jgi:hypothetical protein